MGKNVMLLIMDGFGLRESAAGNAVAAARKPNLDRLMGTCPFVSLDASGLAVGLPDGQMGNSEVGHTNMGAGRVVWQELTKISESVKDGSFFDNEELVAAAEHVKKNDSSLHIMGLLSDGGVHSHITHLFALLDLAKGRGLEKVYVHAITDGRDTPPQAAKKYIRELEAYMKTIGCGKIASVTGRFYAMDRDKRWDRVKAAYDNYMNGSGRRAESAEKLVNEADANGESDEFIKPGMVIDNGDIHTINDNDAVIFFNFRPDRAREITRAIVTEDFDGFERSRTAKGLKYVCFTTYDAQIKGVSIAFKPQSLANTLGEYISAKGLKQLRTAETEKYAHVTFFFNGGIEEPYPGEDRILVPSPKVATYDLQPEMSAYEVTDNAAKAISSSKYDLIIMNLANCDMVGHTGVYDAAVKAVETVDGCVGKIVQAIKAAGGKLLITADHGNADCMRGEDGRVMTAHTSNPVPLILVDEKGGRGLADGGALCDIAPTLLELMGLEIPSDMSGHSLLRD